MAIIPVNEIPKPNRPQNLESVDYRGKVRTDLDYAWNEHIPMFEFVGYKSNASVGQYAREEAYKIVEKFIYAPARKYVEETLQEELKKKLGKAVKYIRTEYHRTSGPIIRISGVTINGVKRVFGEIDWDCADHYAETLLAKYREKYSDKAVIAELKEKLAREKSRTHR